MAPLDDVLLEEALAMRERCADLELELARQKADFGRAVRRLHSSGASLREIAVALQLSHQRVHQLVGPATAESWISRLTRAGRRGGRHISLSCSFCGAAGLDPRQMVAGPGVWICDRCIASATRVATGGPPEGEDDGSRFAIVPHDERGVHCDFCGRGPRRPDRIVRGGAGPRTICGSCLSLCHQILAERPNP